MNHKHKTGYRYLYLTLALTGLLLLIGWPRLVEAMPLTAQHHLENAWRIAADMGRFEYDTSVVQTIRPTARLENAGRQPTTQHLTAEGMVDRPNKTMQMRLWSSGVGRDGIELKVVNGQAFGRTDSSTDWQEIPNPTDIFAPGGDPLGFLVAAQNVRDLGFGVRGSGEKGVTLDNEIPNSQALIPDSYKRYAFEINGPRYAAYVRNQLEATLRAQGELPAGLHLGLVQQYVNMTGHGEIWLNEAGLPVRQIIHLEFPPEPGALDWTSAEITTSFGDWESGVRDQGILPAARHLWENPTQLFTKLQFLIPNSQPLIPVFGLSLLLTALALAAITHRNSPKFYAAVTGAMIAAMLVTPLLQSNQVQAFAVRQSAKQADFERQQVTQQQLDDIRTELSGRDFNPTLNPLTDTDQQAEATIPSFQSNGEISCSDTLDSDGDGLIDAVECYKLDTLSDAVDSDADGISDITEVEGFTAGGRQWYLDPLNRDSNNDGLPDAVECPTLADVDENGNLSNPLGSSCVDTDGDSTPDVFDFDNDGDGVPDRLDASPNYTDDLSAELHSQLKLNLSGYDGTERSLVVDFQLRPSDLSHLFQTNNVLDWPSNDTQGQLARVNDNTLADLGFVGDKTANGDMLLAPMLEIKIPAPTEDSANPSGGLPLQADFSGVIATSPLTAWLDIDLLAEYSISVNQDGEGAPIYAYLPLSVIEDPTGNTPVAWGTQMLYQPGDTDWGDAHEMRLLWLVQMINDTCDTSGMGEDDDYETWCKPDGPNWSSNLTIAQTYYEDFYLSGLTVREDYGMDIAVLAQDNALSVDYENYLWHLSNGLQKAFGEGQLIDDNNDGTGDRRFDFAELVSRFEGSSGTVWDIPVSRIAVNSASYPRSGERFGRHGQRPDSRYPKQSLQRRHQRRGRDPADCPRRELQNHLAGRGRGLRQPHQHP
jgi:hypothetical protein